MNTKRITEIKPSHKLAVPYRKRVCAYARVSRDTVNSAHSLEAQKAYYAMVYGNNPEYEFVGIFSDFGISGAKESRPAFDEMMRRARNKEFDMIVTKSISRFARNILLLMNVIRELRELGIAILFEKEGMNTMNRESDMFLSIYGSIAEEERKQVSSNIKWSIQKQYQKGNPCLSFNRIFGYDDGFVINEEQAKTVRLIYELYLQGECGDGIARMLREKRTPYCFGKDWSGQRVLRMLSNPIYCGDLLMQKFYSDSRGKLVRNHGELPMYFVEGHHEGIVSKEIWLKAQKIRKERSNMYGRSKNRNQKG